MVLDATKYATARDTFHVTGLVAIVPTDARETGLEPLATQVHVVLIHAELETLALKCRLSLS